MEQDKISKIGDSLKSKNRIVLSTRTASNVQIAILERNGEKYTACSSVSSLRGTVPEINQPMFTIDIACAFESGDIGAVKRGFVSIIKEKLLNDIASFNALVDYLGQERKISGRLNECHQFDSISLEDILRVLLRNEEKKRLDDLDPDSLHV